MPLAFKAACFAELELAALDAAYLCACTELRLDPRDSYGRELVAKFIVDRATDDFSEVSDLVQMAVTRFGVEPVIS